MNSETNLHHSSLPLLFLIAAALLFLTNVSGAGYGINYGQIANNLPDPKLVVPLIRSIKAARLRLYDADSRVLQAFANTGIEFTVSLGNEYMSEMQNSNKALDWVKKNVQCYLPATKITYIAVGNEVLTSNDTTFSPSNLLPAMESIHNALVSLKLDKQVTVTTAHNFGILDISYPPSASKFRKELNPILKSILDFHCKNGSPFMINAYPYFAYKSNSKQISLNFVLFKGDGFVDSNTGLAYDNMFYAQLDAVHSAMEKLGFKNVCLQVAETGWPSMGDADEIGASAENAKMYNRNLLKLINKKKGTPMRPDLDLNVYLFALFNENQKPGPTSEKNFGLFKPDGTAVYDLGFNLTGTGSTNTSSSGGSVPTAFEPPAPDGYLSINAGDGERLSSGGAILFIFCSTILALQL